MKTYRAESESHRDSSVVGAVGDTTDYGRRALSSSQAPKHDIRLPYGLAQIFKHTERTGGRLPAVVVPEVQRRQRSASCRYLTAR